jgi:protein-disulfide isomerase
MAKLVVPVGPDDHARGNANAPVTVVEYGDYQCPYCAAAEPNVERMMAHVGDHVRLVFRHFPLTEVHPMAMPAAEAAEFAASRGVFWRMHEALFASQPALSMPLLYRLADALRLPEQELRDALEGGVFTPRINAQFVGGVRSGVNGTPTFFINGSRLDVPPTYETLVAAVNGLLALRR